MGTKWKVTITRIGVGCSNYAVGAPMWVAFEKAMALSEPYVTGVSGPDGSRFGPDLRSEFNKGFNSCVQRISHKPSVSRVSWNNGPFSADVTVERIKT